MTDLVIAVSLLLIGICVYFWINFTTRKYKNFLKNLPGPKTFPGLGNALDIRSTSDFVLCLTKYMNSFGDIIQVWFGAISLKIFITDHNLIEVLLSSTKNITKSDEYLVLKTWLGQGLLTSEPMKWKKHRKILTPAFHFQILEKFVESFEGPTVILINKIQKSVGLKSVNIYPLISLNSLDIICETSMGTKVNAQENDESEYVNAVKEIGTITTQRIISPIKQFDFLYRFTRDYYREKAALKILHGYTESVIQQRKDQLMGMSQDFENVDQALYNRKKLSFLDVLLMSRVDGKPINDIDIREEVDTFLFEGHDTTASGISFTLHKLANHPDVQQKAYDEQRDLFGDTKDPNIKMQDLNNMKYLELVLKESMRLNPPVPLIGRCTTEDMEADGQIYPKGLSYLVNVMGLHRNPKYFEHPDTFDPMRFANMDSKLSYAYIPFSAGPRNCIGQRFAILEMKYVISSILRHFKLAPASPNEELVLALELVLVSKNGVCMSIQERN